ncbi:MAG: hypothetical protein COA74_06240 [Gammaproteobacteria bacterium]|nr:MAG: hypothetical protein COA74_06240 [Gammaproteobacteria bacterium]
MNLSAQKYDNEYFERHSDGLKLCIELIRCTSQLDRIIDKNLRQEFGQSISRFDLLAQLFREGDQGLSVGELGQRLISAKGNITGLINRMIKDDLLYKKASKLDKRSFQVYLSKKGLTLFKNMADNHGSLIYKLFGSITRENINDMTRLLSDVRSSLSITQLKLVSEESKDNK